MALSTTSRTFLLSVLAVVMTALASRAASGDVVDVTAVGRTWFTYHLAVPEGCAGVRHIAVSRADYDGIRNILIGMGADMTPASYLDTFGFTITEDTDVTLDKYSETNSGDAINIYSNMPFMVIAGQVDAAGKVVDSTVRTVEFNTQAAPASPYTVEVTDGKVTSTSVEMDVTPQEGVQEYRMYFMSRKDYLQVLAEGEAQVRATIIGRWDDSQNSTSRVYTGAVTLEPGGLIPSTDYVLGVVAFDADGGESTVIHAVRTAAPSGAKATVDLSVVTDQYPDLEAWNTAVFHLSMSGAVEMRYCVATVAQYETVLAREGVTLEKVIYNNGFTLDEPYFSQACTPEGQDFAVNELQSATPYRVGVVAYNNEKVPTIVTLDFTTAAPPAVGTDTRRALVGKWTANTRDASGATLTFPVTIAEGVNATTTAAYTSLNRLVCLGFGPEARTHAYRSPQDMMDQDGLSAADADAAYGPKWFLEFNQDGTVHVPTAVVDNAFTWAMYQSGSYSRYLWGFAVKSNGRTVDSSEFSFPVDISDDLSTITVRPYERYNEWADETYLYYPGMAQSTSVWSGTPVLQLTAPLVLTRDASGVDAVGASDAVPSVQAVSGGIAASSAARVYDLSGRLVGAVEVPGTVALPAGIYVVRPAEGPAVKVAVGF